MPLPVWAVRHRTSGYQSATSPILSPRVHCFLTPGQAVCACGDVWLRIQAWAVSREREISVRMASSKLSVANCLNIQMVKGIAENRDPNLFPKSAR